MERDSVSTTLDFDSWSITVTVTPMRVYEEQNGQLVSFPSQYWHGVWLTSDGISGSAVADDPQDILNYALNHVQDRRRIWQNPDGSPH